MKATLCVLWLVLGMLTPAFGATFTVINTNDSGAGSLRDAITSANGSAGPHTIQFAIPGSGVHVITLTSGVLAINQSMTIDGYTQGTAHPNTLVVGDDAVILVEINPGGGGAISLFGTSAGSTIKGLSIVNSNGSIGLFTAGNHVVGNFLGVDPAGNTASDGSITAQAGGNVIGGTAPADRNLIAGNSQFIDLSSAPFTIIQGNYMGLNAAGTGALNGNGIGISVGPSSSGCLIGGTAPGAGNVIANWASNAIQILSDDTTVQGNFIGTDATGTVRMNPRGGLNGIAIFLGSNVLIGGSIPGAGNVISAANGPGIITVSGTTNAIVQGNKIGTDVSGNLPIGNALSGLCLASSSVVVGGTGLGEGNRIAFNQTNGVNVNASLTGAAIRGNSFEGNAGLGIWLNGRCDLRGLPTPNDPGDADTGANNQQNYPIITSVTYGASSTRIQGQFNSAPNTKYDLDFYANPACSTRPQEFLQAKTYLGPSQVTTDGAGDAAIDVTLPVAVENGARIAATATDPAGNTSEISQRIIFTSSPLSGPPAGGTTLAFTGQLFAAPATATVGGLAATNVSVGDSTSMSADAPALLPGTVNDIVVDVAGGLTGTLRFGYVSDFLDVPSGQPFHAFVTKLVSNAITAGCGGGNYCPNSVVTRAQMAVFLLRGFNGLCYVPPPATGTVFTDVPANGFAAAFIEALAAAQVTGGCGGGNYCPNSSVTRDQMAVFLLRTAGGPTYVPPACVTPTFSDVPCSSPFARWIEELARRGITAGCGGGNYCPSATVSRGQMAVFLVTTFGLP